MVLGAVVGRLIPLTVLLASRGRLDTADYNTVSTAFMMLSAVAVVVTSGLSTVLVQQIARETVPHRQWAVYFDYQFLAWLLQGAVALALLVFGETLLSRLFGAEVDPRICWPLGLAVLAWPTVLFTMATFNGLHQSARAARVGAFGGVLQGVGMMPAMLLSEQPGLGMVWGLAVGSLLALAIAAFSLRLTWAPLSRAWQSRRAEMISRWGQYRLDLTMAIVSAASVMPVSLASGALLVHTPGGQRELAAFYVMEQCSLVLLFVPALAGQVLMPMVSREMANADGTARSSITFRWVRGMVATAVGALLLAALLGLALPSVIDFLRLPSITPSEVWGARWMILYAMLSLPLMLLGAVVVGSGSILAGSLLNVWWGACTLLATFALLDQGNQGFQLARAVASLSMLCLGLIYVIVRERR